MIIPNIWENLTGAPKQPVGDSGAVGVIALLLLRVEINNEIVPH